ncbi:PadR family transcriptional regulator [Lactobacillus mulieris]|jgi:hypothetical protein|uniref:PadR family transcriptional regulator n=1 Tax=Lactobacillus mulieris TaxID=2508708 RepID=A0AAP3M451_9LACO|nr:MULTISPECIES: PadR family transcriptional regulator [Lactobacillus]EEU20838.1 hypothetical protein HMPREF0525_00874 [Lactobacillus jensenii 27-2-CHN]EEX23626.1 transcriptional regulator, PadR family [Lactobacillus jensenii 115-3-CHN]EFH30182.1 transcriptional regulator, PadR family [Lactobacillus jensenii JV-V16]KAA9244097.1 PadR family transcriptional regulator [Lactobacillus jensenii]MCT7689383.1 PadR family transcriptional regulator [Lactobacillus crispatus]
MQRDISSQILKGILQGVMLTILEKNVEYGYSLSKKLDDYGLTNVPKGTIYPLLASMEKKKLIEGRMQESPDGPARKYYYLTPAGQQAKLEFQQEWQQLEEVVNKVLGGE